MGYPCTTKLHHLHLMLLSDAILVYCRFNYCAALLRMPLVVLTYHGCAYRQSTQLLLEFYGVELPSVSTPSSATAELHEPSARLLKDTNPWMLTKYIPANIGTDDNCLFRSVSYALYDTEVHHIHLRLLCVIEALLHEQLYNSSSVEFYGPYAADKWLCLPEYDAFICSMCVDGSYSDMLSVLAVSTVTQKPIQTVWPLYVAPGAQSPCTKFVMGNGINSTSHPLYVLWTVCTYDGINSGWVNINHFVPLIERPVAAEFVIFTDSATDPSDRSETYCDKPAITQHTDTDIHVDDVDTDGCVNDTCRNQFFSQ